MRNVANKMLPPVFLLGIFISFSTLLWLGIYASTNRADALLLGAMVLLCAMLQVTAFLGVRTFKSARLWPAGCMLASAPAVLWCAYAGPDALYGGSIDLLDFTALNAKPPFYYFALPVLAAGVLACVAWLVVGLLFLVADVVALSAARKAARKAAQSRLPGIDYAVPEATPPEAAVAGVKKAAPSKPSRQKKPLLSRLLPRGKDAPPSSSAASTASAEGPAD